MWICEMMVLEDRAVKRRGLGRVAWEYEDGLQVRMDEVMRSLQVVCGKSMQME
jgi:hypothetical protein